MVELGPQSCAARIDRAPSRESEVMKLIGTYQMGDLSQPVHIATQVFSEQDGRPDPEAAVRKPNDYAASWIWKAVEADDVALKKPHRLVDPLKHEVSSRGQFGSRAIGGSHTASPSAVLASARKT